jgi:ABC-type lipoprotein release transport system permease subunit
MMGIAVLIAVALLSTWIPARRAAAVQPMEALRHE